MDQDLKLDVRESDACEPVCEHLEFSFEPREIGSNRFSFWIRPIHHGNRDAPKSSLVVVLRADGIEDETLNLVWSRRSRRWEGGSHAVGPARLYISFNDVPLEKSPFEVPAQPQQPEQHQDVVISGFGYIEASMHGRRVFGNVQFK
jgi:hypothetical protein